jgi:hypothetical protein
LKKKNQRRTIIIEGKPLEYFFVAFGIFLITFSAMKIFFARRLFFQTSFLGFYFGSILLWWFYTMVQVFEWRIKWKKKSR